MPAHDVSMVKWLIAAGAVSGTLAGWMTLASGAGAATNNASVAAESDWLQNPFPTLASPFRSASSGNASTSSSGEITATPKPTLRSVSRPTVVYVVPSTRGGSAPATTTRSSKPK
jgi:hypothetical protein